MKRNIFGVFVSCFAVLLLAACKSSPPTANSISSNVTRDQSPKVSDFDLEELVSGDNAFAFDLYHQAASQPANLFYSPYSVSIALGMVSAGANGDTAAQMAQTLHFTLPAERLHPAFNRLALELDSRSKVEGLKPDQAFRLSVANSLWGQNGFHFEQPFLDTLALNYAAGMRLADYRKDPESARRAINDWVSQSTEKRIQDIIPPGRSTRSPAWCWPTPCISRPPGNPPSIKPSPNRRRFICSMGAACRWI